MKHLESRTIVLDVLMIFGLTFFVGTVAAIEMPEQKQLENGVVYMTGGIAEEAEMMRGVANNYGLEIAVVQKLNEREEFLADVKVKVVDAHKNVALEVVTEGPYLWANLPSGSYLISAEFNGVEKRQKVNVNASKHQKIVFWWPITGQPELEDSSE